MREDTMTEPDPISARIASMGCRLTSPRPASRSMPRAASRVRKRSAVMTCRMPALARAARRDSGLEV